MHDATLAPPLSFFYTLSMPCPYLDGHMERRIVCDLSSRRGRHAHDTLARAGFRRTQHLAYRPACIGCQACVPVRIRVADFIWSKSQRRVLRANADLTAEWVPNEATREQYALFSRYQIERHADGEMAGMDFADYASMVERSPIETHLVEHRDPQGGLRAAILVDMQDDGPSAVYSFFAAEDDRRALGRYMILDLVRQAAERGQPYVYLGYWIARCRKMAYKVRFQPVEGLIDGRWAALSPEMS